ncbi:MAG: HDOD domain-containing protein [Candidatus Cloacimonetes bacterium]|nr:HDOD domain-containing protein [Candidatus Cloacimonadota bacterium]
MYRDKILKKLNDIDEVPTMLTIAMEIDRLTQNINTSAAQISNIVKIDPALTAKVLKISNSPLYASTRKIDSLQQAIARLGFDEIRKISMSVAIINSFKHNNIDYEKFWVHSIAVAYVSAYLQKISNLQNTEKAFSCGLLHDVGIIVLDQYLGDLYKKVFDIASHKSYSLELVEKKILGICHAEVGAILLRKWRVPDSIAEAVMHHHRPQDSTSNPDLTKLVYMANFICNNRGIDNGTNFFPEGFYDDIWDDLSIPIDEVDRVIEEVKTNLEKAKQLLHLGGI